MAYLRALEKHVGGVRKLLELTEDALQALVQALQKAPITLDPERPVYKAVARVENLSDEDAVGLATALLSLYAGRAAHSEDSTDSFTDDVIQTIEQSGESFEEGQRETVRRRLTTILDVEPIAVSAKASGLLFEHDRVYSQGKVFSDLRPIFGSSAEDSPKAAIILHSLAIHYFQDGRHKEFFVVMDTGEVEALIKTLERAKAKAETLKAVLASANVPYIEEAE
jgi:hypothetical protein